MDFNMLVLLLIGLALIVGGFLMYKKSGGGDDVKHIDPSSQEGAVRNKDSIGPKKTQSNSTKTAQLEALRDRLGDNAGKKPQSSAKRIGSGAAKGNNNASANNNANNNANAVSSNANVVQSFVVKSEPAKELKEGLSKDAQTAETNFVESWIPTDDLGESAVDSFLRKPSMSGSIEEAPDDKVFKSNESLIGTIGELPALPQQSVSSAPLTSGSTNLQKPEYRLPMSSEGSEVSNLSAPQVQESALKQVTKQVEHSKLQPSSMKNQIITGLASGGKALILLVDDSKVIRVKTEKLLSAAGYSVALAIDGIDALTKLETIRPDLVITDIEMPNLDGFGLVRSLKGNLQTNEIPVIVMTSHVNLHLDIAATEGINGFLPKPFNDQDLLDQVSYLINS